MHASVSPASGDQRDAVVVEPAPLAGDPARQSLTMAPDVMDTMHAVESPQARSIALVVIAVILVFAALYFARDFFIPLVVALLLSLALSPVVRWLARHHVPPPLGAALVLIVGAGAVAGGAYELATPVRVWVQTAPAVLDKATRRLRAVIRPVERVTNAADQVERATTGGGAGPAKVLVQGPSLSSRVFGTGRALIASLLEIVVLLYSLLAVGDLFLQKLIDVLPRRGDREKAISIARTTEASIASYLLLTTVINVGEGLVVAGVMALLGMPTPFLWGALVAVAEFVPYLGMLTILAVLALASLTTFADMTHALLVPASFLAINFLQGYVVTPFVMSRRLTLNPVVTFVALTLWWWMWGIPGALLAVPLLAVFKICCDHVESLASIGAFLGERTESERRRSVLRRLRPGTQTVSSQRV
jgi:predicted PurR-regulated permease PerM